MKNTFEDLSFEELDQIKGGIGHELTHVLQQGGGTSGTVNATDDSTDNTTDTSSTYNGDMAREI